MIPNFSFFNVVKILIQQEYAERIGGVGDWGGRRRITDLRAPTDIFLSIFGRTELRIGPSRAKNCQEVDFEVRFSLEASKPAQKGEKRFPRPKNLAVFFFRQKLN